MGDTKKNWDLKFIWYFPHGNRMGKQCQLIKIPHFVFGTPLIIRGYRVAQNLQKLIDELFTY